MKKILFLVLILTVSIFAACQSASNDVSTNSETAKTTSETKVKEVSPAEARAAVEDKNAQFIDVRTATEYAGGHAPDAVNFPLDSLTGDLARLDKSKPIYVICQSGKRSEAGAKILNDAGFNQVFGISGGTSAWTTAGFPIEKTSASFDDDSLDENKLNRKDRDEKDEERNDRKH